MENVVSELPQDVWLNVFSLMRFGDLLNARLVCKSWADLFMESVTTIPKKWEKRCTNELLCFLPSLVSLSLDPASEVSDDGLSKCLSLRRLSLAEVSGVSDSSVSLLQKLTYFFLYSENITDASVSCLTNLKELVLHRHASEISDRSVSRLTKLEALKLPRKSCVTDKTLKCLTNLTYLKLEGSNSSITDEGLSGNTQLQTLILSNNKTVSDAGISGLTNLTQLGLELGCIITDDVLSELTNITDLSLYRNTKVTFASVSLLTNLKTINIRYSLLNCDEFENWKLKYEMKVLRQEPPSPPYQLTRTHADSQQTQDLGRRNCIVM